MRSVFFACLLTFFCLNMGGRSCANAQSSHRYRPSFSGVLGFTLGESKESILAEIKSRDWEAKQSNRGDIGVVSVSFSPSVRLLFPHFFNYNPIQEIVFLFTEDETLFSIGVYFGSEMYVAGKTISWYRNLRFVEAMENVHGFPSGIRYDNKEDMHKCPLNYKDLVLKPSKGDDVKPKWPIMLSWESNDKKRAISIAYVKGGKEVVTLICYTMTARNF